MKKISVETIYKILFIIAFIAIFFLFLKNPAPVQTNLLKAITTNSHKDQLIVNLSQKYSGVFNIIFESEDSFLMSEAKNEFVSSLNTKSLVQNISQTYAVTELLNTYKFYHYNLLSQATAKKLKQGNVKDVKLEGLQRLYNPLEINLLPIENDPFLLFSDFLKSLENTNESKTIKINNKYYESLNLKIKDEIALSPTLLNNEIKELISLKNKIEKSNPNVKISLAGTPIHTYYASSASMKEINVICVLSALFIVFLCMFYFKSYKILIPIGSSLLLGMTVGYILTSAFFSSIHVLTFVFSTTLIGICVDYSLHYFAQNNSSEPLIKSLTISMVTTVSAFLILLFSDMDLLKQIAVFTSGGLFSVYIFVVLCYPTICRKLNIQLNNKADISRIFRTKISTKSKILFFVIIGITTIIGLTQLTFNDGIKDMYKPPKHLIESEKLSAQINGKKSDTKILIIKANNIQELLEKEEQIGSYLPSGSFYSLSLLVPSIKTQKENQNLRKYLYKQELNNYADFLTPTIKNKILNEKPREDFITVEKLPLQISEKFFLEKNTSIMIAKDISPQIVNNLSGVNIIDLQKDISKRVSQCRISCLKLIIPVFLGLFILLTIVYKKPICAIRIITPPILGCLFTLGLLGIFKQPISLFHVLAMFLITGFSLDYSVFRFNSVKNSIDSKSAVLISCATSVFSFLLLSMTSFKLISSLGLVLAIGLTSSYIFSLFLISKE